MSSTVTGQEVFTSHKRIPHNVHQHTQSTDYNINHYQSPELCHSRYLSVPNHHNQCCSQVIYQGFQPTELYYYTEKRQLNERHHQQEKIKETARKQIESESLQMKEYAEKIEQLDQLHQKAIQEIVTEYENKLRIAQEQVRIVPQVVEKIVHVPVVQQHPEYFDGHQHIHSSQISKAEHENILQDNFALQQRTEEQQRQILHLKEQIDKLEIQLQSERERMEQEINYHKQLKQDQLQNERDGYIIEVHNQHHKIKELQNNLEEAEKQIISLKEIIMKKEVEIEILEKKVAINAQLREKIQDLEEALQHWKLQAEQANCQLNCKEIDLQKVRDKLLRKKEKLKIAINKLKEEKELWHVEHEKEIQSVNNIALDLQKQIQKLIQEQELKDKEVDKWRSRSSVHDYKLEELGQQVQEKQTLINQLEEQIKLEKHATLQKEHDIHHISQEHKKDLNAKDIEIFKMSERENQIMKQMQQQEIVNKTNLNTDKQQYEQKLELLQHQLHVAHQQAISGSNNPQIMKELNEKESQIQKLNNNMDLTNEKLRNSQEKEKALELKLQDKDRQLIDLQTRFQAESSEYQQKIKEFTIQQSSSQSQQPQISHPPQQQQEQIYHSHYPLQQQQYVLPQHQSCSFGQPTILIHDSHPQCIKTNNCSASNLQQQQQHQTSSSQILHQCGYVQSCNK